jgi:hypothetical protein
MYDLFVITPRDTHFDSIAIMILSWNPTDPLRPVPSLRNSWVERN